MAKTDSRKTKKKTTSKKAPAKRSTTARRKTAKKKTTRRTSAGSATAKSDTETTREQEIEYIDELIRRVTKECPKRQATSEDEARALDIFLAELESAGLSTSEHRFEFNDNLYKNLALHAGMGVAGTTVSGTAPLAGLALHLLAATSYRADSTRRAYILRRLFPFKPSKNVLGTLPADGDPSLRIVFLGHADAAFTGMPFWPRIAGLSAREGPESLKFLRRGVQLMVTTQLMLAGCDALRVLLGPLAAPLRPVEHVLTIPSWLTLLLNTHVILKNEIVPGANDNLSGSAALPVLARRLMSKRHPKVEYVFCVTGCEEASLGGADALAKHMEGRWDKESTVVIALDSISNGALRFHEIEGEVRPRRIADWLRDVLHRTAKSDARFSEVTGYELPVGATDAAAFQAHGWAAVGLTCLDPELGTPRHYHLPTDDPDHLDLNKLLFSIDFIEKLAEQIVAEKLE